MRRTVLGLVVYLLTIGAVSADVRILSSTGGPVSGYVAFFFEAAAIWRKSRY